MLKFAQCVGKTRFPIIGMIHVGALPGTPKNNSSVDALVDHACRESEVYESCGVDAVLIENMHDLPYLQTPDMGPEITASLTRICTEVKKVISSSVTCGIQVLASANKEALAIAQASNLQFIRAEGYVFSHVADEGFTNACSGTLLRYRRQIGANDILIFTDIKKKHWQKRELSLYPIDCVSIFLSSRHPNNECLEPYFTLRDSILNVQK